MSRVDRTLCVLLAAMLLTLALPIASSRHVQSPIPSDALLSAAPILVAGRADEAEDLPQTDKLDAFLQGTTLPRLAASTIPAHLQPVEWSVPLRWEARKPVGIHAPPS